MNEACGSGCAGEARSTLAGLYPYVRFAASDKLSFWTTFGRGRGGTLLSPAVATPIASTIETRKAESGLRGVLRSASKSGGFELALRADALFTSTSSEAAANLAQSVGATSRLRLRLQGSRAWRHANDAVLTPSFELGLRHDGGDAETGSGLEMGASLGYEAPSMGLAIEVKLRGLLVHEQGDYEDWGVGGAARFAPGEGGRGVSLRLGSDWGVPSSQMDRLWTGRDGGPQPGVVELEARLDAEIGYGLDTPHGLLTPRFGFSVSGEGRAYRVGGGWNLGAGFDASVEVGLRELAAEGGRVG